MSIVCVVFFFFKQKTAYEMRISDWSSDVCSSDLIHPGQNLGAARALLPAVRAKPRQSAAEHAVHETLAAWAYGFSSQVLCLPSTRSEERRVGKECVSNV